MRLNSTHLISFTNHQEAIWLEAKLYSAKPIFNIGSFIRLNGVPDHRMLEQAIAHVITHYDAFHLKVSSTTKKFGQIFKLRHDFELPHLRFENQTAAEEWMEEEHKKPIDIHDDQLYNISLVQYADDGAFLFLKYHHIIIDGWGRSKVIEYIAEAYNQLNQGKGVATRAKVSFKGYLNRRKSISTAQKLEQLSYWRSAFNEFERKRLFREKDPSVINSPSSRQRLKLEQSLYQQLRIDGHSPAKSRFYFLLAALYWTLASRFGNKEIVFGIPLLNRNNEEELNTLGYFIGLIPLRLSFEKDISFNELVASIIEEFSSSRGKRDLAIHEINKEVGVNFSNGTQLYDVVFSFEEHSYNHSFGDLNVIEAGTFSSYFEQNPLVIHVQNFIDRTPVYLEFDYNQNFLNDDEVSSLMQSYHQAIESFIAAPDTKLTNVSCLLEQELMLVRDYSHGEPLAIEQKGLLERISNTVDAHSQKTALIDVEGSLTFSELFEHAQALSTKLLEAGLESGEIVGIDLPRSKRVIVAMVAVLLSECAYLLVDIDWPTHYKARIFEHTGVSTKILLEKNGIDFKVEVLKNKPNVSARAVGLAYVIFTSGTTGKPKGVGVSHANLLNLMSSLEKHIYGQYALDSKLGLLSSFHFDASIQNIYACLLLGFELTILPEEIRADGKKIVEFLQDHQIEICDATPTHLTSVLGRVKDVPRNFPIKHMLVGGEVFTNGLALELSAWFDNNVLVTNLYGPSECTVDTTLFTFSSHLASQLSEVPIGEPINNAQIWILGEHQQVLPPGAIGELYICGAGVTNGYVSHSDSDDRKFFESLIADGLCYRTGDLGSWSDEGELLYRGRMDSQVKIRGHRVELPEIESQLSSLENVKRGAVIVEQNAGQTILIGCLQSSIPLDQEVVKQKLLKKLPSYKVPHLIYCLNDFPSTKTGKIDRIKLEEEVKKIRQNPAPMSIVLSETEKRLLAIWKDILNANSIDLDASFFELGGDSLSLVFLLADIEEEFKIELAMNQFSNANSVREVARMIETGSNSKRSRIDLQKELQNQDLDFIFKRHSSVEKLQSETALLTGATGFVGAYLLRELLQKYDQVICLLRGTSEAQAKTRLQNILDRYELNVDTESTKLQIILGDLADKNLGLSDDNQFIINDRVNVIYHCGANVNFISNYEALLDCNVNATIRLLRFCVESKKQFNFISTKGVFSSIEADTNENSLLDEQVHYHDKGYEASKWVAGIIVRLAQANGHNANIFRLGRITADSVSGHFHNKDFFYRFMRSSLQLKTFPIELLNQNTDLTPVDLTARTIVELAINNTGRCFHLINNKRLEYKDIMEHFQGQGIEIEYKSYNEWMKNVSLIETDGHRNPLFPFIPILKDKKWLVKNDVAFDNRSTVRFMDSIGIKWPQASKIIESQFKLLIEQELGSPFSTQDFGNSNFSI